MDPKILPENMGTIVEDLIETIVTSKLKMRRSYLIERISKLDSKNDKKENDKEIVKKLCKELLELDRELKLHQ
jgi:DNA primase